MKRLMTLLLSALLPAAGAQLLQTLAVTAQQPALQGFSAAGNALRRGAARVELDTAGGRVVGVYAAAPLQDTDAAARAVLAAWGAPAEAVPDLQKVLDDPGFQKLAAEQPFTELSKDGLSSVNIRRRGDAWQVYTALKVYPARLFPKASAPLGSATAPARLDIFSDYQCPYCQRLWNTALAEWRKAPQTYRIQYQHFPLPYHALALPAARYAECASQQGRFWEFSDRLNEGYAAWSKQPEAQAEPLFTAYAQSAGVKADALGRCLASDGQGAGLRQEAEAAAQALSIQGTPTVFLNGVRLANYTNTALMGAIREVTEAAPSAETVVERRLKTLR